MLVLAALVSWPVRRQAGSCCPAAQELTICASTSAPAEAAAISVYEAIGGRAAVVAAVDGLYGRLLADPALSPFFPGGVAARYRRYLVTILGEALGGPERYRGAPTSPRLTVVWASVTPILGVPPPTFTLLWTISAFPAA